MLRLIYSSIAVATMLCALVVAGTGTAQAGGGCHADGLSDATGTLVRIEGACFTPTVLRVQPGDTVTWTNFDSFAHTVTGAASNFGDFTEFGQGQSVSHEFAVSGVYPYFCNLHSGMIGAIVVGDGGAPVPQASVAPASAPHDGGDGALLAGAASGGGLLLVLAVGAAVYAVRRR